MGRWLEYFPSLPKVSWTGIIKNMAQIKDTSVIRTPETTVDPRLFLPPDVIDMSFKSIEIDPDNPISTPDLDEPGDETTGDGVVYDTFDTTEGVGTNNDTLPTPQSLSIVQQTIKFAPDGRAYVDVIVEVEDVPGITNYELRINKV